MKMVSFMLPSLSNAASSLCAHPDRQFLAATFTITPGRYHMYLTERLRDKIPAVFLISYYFLSPISLNAAFSFSTLPTRMPSKRPFLSIDSVQPFHACTSGRFPACKVRCMVIDQDVHLSQFSVQHGFNKFRFIFFHKEQRDSVKS